MNQDPSPGTRHRTTLTNLNPPEPQRRTKISLDKAAYDKSTQPPYRKSGIRETISSCLCALGHSAHSSDAQLVSHATGFLIRTIINDHCRTKFNTASTSSIRGSRLFQLSARVGPVCFCGLRRCKSRWSTNRPMHLQTSFCEIPNLRVFSAIPG